MPPRPEASRAGGSKESDSNRFSTSRLRIFTRHSNTPFEACGPPGRLTLRTIDFYTASFVQTRPTRRVFDERNLGRWVVI
jgi:hypothetical protein